MRTKRCGHCGASYDDAALSALTPVQTLREADLATIAMRWPSGMIVDVRACARCASPIACLSREAAARASS